MGNHYELFCIELPFSPILTSELRELAEKGQWPEDRLFGTVTLEAASAWEELVDVAVLIFLRHVFSGSTTDEEICASLETTPDWILN